MWDLILAPACLPHAVYILKNIAKNFHFQNDADNDLKNTILYPSIQWVHLPLARQINFHLLNFSPASIFKVLQCGSKLVKMLSECQTAWIWMRRRVTRRLIRIQAVCILD